MKVERELILEISCIGEMLVSGFGVVVCLLATASSGCVSEIQNAADQEHVRPDKKFCKKIQFKFYNTKSIASLTHAPKTFSKLHLNFTVILAF